MTSAQIPRELLLEAPEMTTLQRALLIAKIPILDHEQVERYKRRAKRWYAAKRLTRAFLLPALLILLAGALSIRWGIEILLHSSIPGLAVVFLIGFPLVAVASSKTLQALGEGWPAP